MGPYRSPKNLSEALLASRSGWCGEMVGSISQGTGMVGASASPGLTLKAWGKEGWEAAGCAREGLGAC